jgi:hypothetical protein
VLWLQDCSDKGSLQASGKKSIKMKFCVIKFLDNIQCLHICGNATFFEAACNLNMSNQTIRYKMAVLKMESRGLFKQKLKIQQQLPKAPS